VHLRRALLLFAIVLGMAALVASISRPIEERRRADTAPRQPREPGPPKAAPTPAPALRPALSFDASEPSTKRLPVGEAATIRVSVPVSGSVEIPDLGRIAPATPDTPATFPVLATRPGRYELLFTPSAGDEPERAGRLVVTSER
jgi:hypothetical protein